MGTFDSVRREKEIASYQKAGKKLSQSIRE
jgi:hypothetical protein